MNTHDTPPAAAAYYRNILTRGGPAGSLLESREGAEPKPDLTNSGITERLDYARYGWSDVIKRHFGDKPSLHRLTQKLVKQADIALRIVRDDDDALLANNPDELANLESIVRLDGSRPSFMIRDGQVDLTTSPAGSWSDQLIAAEPNLRQALRCVARINYPKASGKFVGTGFLVSDNLLFTNRHVLDAVADKGPTGSWIFRKGVTINFGHEYQTSTMAQVRLPKSVLFSGTTLGVDINHADTDAALIELEPRTAGTEFEEALGIEQTPDWAELGTFIYTIGYPANPGMPAVGSGVTLTLLEQLFKSTYGLKRLAPGELIALDSGLTNRTLAHDATTLGGNSGSAIVHAGRPTMVCGLHYAGRSRVPRTNWGHTLMHILDSVDGDVPVTLRDRLRAQGVLVD
ncbi:trypsin-like serine peptidase [Fibrivirga algicola]|uniref:Trypsin-like peptidase domain-containing protein n=1 Tax=Fibrivirga algicola TaxID=2950420 RepID=A0ABX0QK25_9BACT|nr:serine protease [Fibrivirga algicola]NID11267.1 trypsin-like peptidase domain-containing protein [Fibrivirga algicola]